MNVVLAIPLTLGFIGIENLDRGGHRKVKRGLNLGLFILFLITFIPDLARNHPHRSIAGWDIPGAYYFIPLLALLVAIFPFSLYLNWKQKKSTSQPTSNNAS